MPIGFIVLSDSFVFRVMSRGLNDIGIGLKSFFPPKRPKFYLVPLVQLRLVNSGDNRLAVADNDRVVLVSGAEREAPEGNVDGKVLRRDR